MKKIACGALCLLGILAALLLVLWLRGDVGITENRMRAEAGGTELGSQWERRGCSQVGDNLAAFLTWPKADGEGKLSLYVKHGGLSLGWFFRFGGSNSAIEASIAEFRVEGQTERAFVSMNRVGAAYVTIDDGTGAARRELFAGEPFVMLLPLNCGTVTFYDTDGNQLPTQLIYE